MTLQEFEHIIETAVEKLPEKFRDILEKNQVRLIPRTNVPKPLREKYKNHVVFGVFIGVPFGRFTNIQTEPTRIELYKSSFERYYRDPKQIEQQIVITVVHEIAHYFGFSEQEIRKNGY